VAYRDLFQSELNSGVIDQIRSATTGNLVLGDTDFVEQMARKAGGHARLRAVGRPPGPNRKC
jgi:hypothetical protein